uniref:Uncharacterized protein n=1 Tax=Glossina pallidipes TaxID=7398 RepID=A0A1A9Z2W9_GLOPL
MARYNGKEEEYSEKLLLIELWDKYLAKAKGVTVDLTLTNTNFKIRYRIQNNKKDIYLFGIFLGLLKIYILIAE